jgi:FixJ family two-component response regulator
LPTSTLISIIDDDEDFLEAIKALIRSLGITANAFRSAMDFLESSNVRDTACLIADVNMPGMTGIELYSHLLESGCAIPTILITASPNDRFRARALRDGVICYLSKPFDEDALLGCISAALNETIRFQVTHAHCALS